MNPSEKPRFVQNRYGTPVRIQRPERMDLPRLEQRGRRYITAYNYPRAVAHILVKTLKQNAYIRGNEKSEYFVHLVVRSLDAKTLGLKRAQLDYACQLAKIHFQPLLEALEKKLGITYAISSPEHLPEPGTHPAHHASAAIGFRINNSNQSPGQAMNYQFVPLRKGVKIRR